MHETGTNSVADEGLDDGDHRAETIIFLIMKVTNTIQSKIAIFSNMLAESVKGIRQVKAYNQEEYEKTKSFEAINQIKNYFIKSAFVSNRLSPLMEFIGSLAVAVSIYAGGVFVLNESMTTGQFMSFLVSLLLAYQPVKALGNLNISVQEGLAGAERIFLLLDTKKDKSENHHEAKNIKLNGNIEFNNVNFSYGEKNVLNNINLTIESGKKTAFVGLSGSGKSTLINLLLRFYEDYRGNIKIDNNDIRSLSLYDLRENISLITQETLLFNESISNNIRYGDMSCNDNKIKEIANLAGVNKFADELSDKLNTIVGESGIKLSGGQRQRIAIARALIKNAPILVMDEATSSLDNITEREIQDALDTLMKGKTTIIIAHRLSTIQNADIIFTLEHGKIENKGAEVDLSFIWVQAQQPGALEWTSNLNWSTKSSCKGIILNYNTTTHLMLVGMREFNNPLLSYFFGIDASLKPFYPILIFLVFIHLSKWIVLGFKKR